MHHKIVPILIIILGVSFLLNAFGIWTKSTGIVWPIVLILIGVQGLMSKNCKCCLDKPVDK
jgi:hypothetical protein